MISGPNFSEKKSIFRRNWGKLAFLDKFQTSRNKLSVFQKKLKKLKVHESVKKFNGRCRKNESLKFTSTSTFRSTSFSASNKIYFKNSVVDDVKNFSGWCRSVIPRLREYQKNANSVELTFCCNSFSQKYKAQIFHLGTRQKLFKNTLEFFNAKMVIYCLALQSCLSEISEKCIHYWYISKFELVSFSNYYFDFFHLAVNQKFQSCRQKFDQKIFVFIHVSISWPSKFFNEAFDIVLNRISTSNLSETTKLTLSVKDLTESLLFLKKVLEYEVNYFLPRIKIIRLRKFQRVILLMIHPYIRTFFSP